MFGDNWDVLETIRERQVTVYEEHRKANGAGNKLDFLKMFPSKFFFFFTS